MVKKDICGMVGQVRDVGFLNFSVFMGSIFTSRRPAPILEARGQLPCVRMWKICFCSKTLGSSFPIPSRFRPIDEQKTTIQIKCLTTALYAVNSKIK